MPKIIRGSTRKVVLCNKFVVKIALNEEGIKQNLNEIKFSEKHPELTTKIYGYSKDYKYIFAERVKPLGETVFHHNNSLEKYPEYKNIYLKLEKLIGSWSDNAQVGITEDGRFVCFDTGHAYILEEKEGEK